MTDVIFVNGSLDLKAYTYIYIFMLGLRYLLADRNFSKLSLQMFLFCHIVGADILIIV